VWETEAEGGIGVGGGAWAMARSVEVIENRTMVSLFFLLVDEWQDQEGRDPDFLVFC
jgi:hypothetical protein